MEIFDHLTIQLSLFSMTGNPELFLGGKWTINKTSLETMASEHEAKDIHGKSKLSWSLVELCTVGIEKKFSSKKISSPTVKCNCF